MFSVWNYMTSKFWWSSSSSANVLIANVKGKISQSRNIVHWEIKDFFLLLQDEGSHICAPSFTFAGKEWVWYLFPRGYKLPDSIPIEFQPTCGWFGMVLVNTTDSEAFGVQFGFSEKKVSTTCKARRFKDTFYSCTLLELADLELRKKDLAPDGVLRVFCEIRAQDEASYAEVSTLAKEIAATSSEPIDFVEDEGIDIHDEVEDERIDIHDEVEDGRIDIHDEVEDTEVHASEWQIFNKDYMADARQLRAEALERRRFVKRRKVLPNDFSEMVYRKLVALTCHPNNRDENSIQ